MAMIKCAECKKRVSDKAVQCPKCGAASEAMLKKPKTNWFAFALLGGFVILFVPAIIVSPATEGATGNKNSIQDGSADGDRFRLIAVRSDPGARYWVTSEMAVPNDPIAVISTKRHGPSGESHNMRIYNCDTREVAYLRDEQASHEVLMKSPNYEFDELQWAPLFRGSIAWEIAKHACRVRWSGNRSF